MKSNVQSSLYIKPSEAPNNTEHKKKEKERKIKEENRKRFLKDDINNKIDLMIKKSQRDKEDKSKRKEEWQKGSGTTSCYT